MKLSSTLVQVFNVFLYAVYESTGTQLIHLQVLPSCNHLQISVRTKNKASYVFFGNQTDFEFFHFLPICKQKQISVGTFVPGGFRDKYFFGISRITACERLIGAVVLTHV